jgi:hypothetical protein
MEVEVEVEVECPFCKKKFTTQVIAEIDPPERDEL